MWGVGEEKVGKLPWEVPNHNQPVVPRRGTAGAKTWKIGGHRGGKSLGPGTGEWRDSRKHFRFCSELLPPLGAGSVRPDTHSEVPVFSPLDSQN